MKNKYSIDEINIGDQVFFEMPYIDNYDLYWTVIGKTGNTLKLEVNEMGIDDVHYVDMEYVQYLLPVLSPM